MSKDTFCLAKLSTEGWIHKGGKCVCFELVRRTKLAKIPICKTQ